MLKFFGFAPSMFFAERISRIMISMALLTMIFAPVPLICILGAGPFAFFYPILILPGFYTLRGTCEKINLFHYIFPAICVIVVLTIRIRLDSIILLFIMLFCFLLYFQSERSLYYLLKLQKTDNRVNDEQKDIKSFCRIYFLNCCKNAFIPTVAGCSIGIIIVFCPQFAWWISSGLFLLFLSLYLYGKR